MDTLYSAPVSIYLRLIDYSGKPVSSDGVATTSINLDNTAFDPSNSQFIRIINYTSSVEQTLNMSSQASGAGAGKIAFNPLVLLKYMDAASPLLFQNAAKGTPYKTAELLFVNAQKAILLKHLYKMVAVKSVSWAADGSSGVVETVAFEYGGQFVLVNKQNPDGRIAKVSQTGWNKIKNIADNDPDSDIVLR